MCVRLCQIPSDRDTSALMLVGSSGKMLVTVNEVSVYQYSGTAGRPFAPDSDLVRLRLSRGANRILAVSRQGIGAWGFSVQIPEVTRRSGRGLLDPVDGWQH